MSKCMGIFFLVFLCGLANSWGTKPHEAEHTYAPNKPGFQIYHLSMDAFKEDFLVCRKNLQQERVEGTVLKDFDRMIEKQENMEKLFASIRDQSSDEMKINIIEQEERRLSELYKSSAFGSHDRLYWVIYLSEIQELKNRVLNQEEIQKHTMDKFPWIIPENRSDSEEAIENPVDNSKEEPTEKTHAPLKSFEEIMALPEAERIKELTRAMLYQQHYRRHVEALESASTARNRMLDAEPSLKSVLDFQLEQYNANTRAALADLILEEDLKRLDQ